MFLNNDKMKDEKQGRTQRVHEPLAFDISSYMMVLQTKFIFVCYLYNINFLYNRNSTLNSNDFYPLQITEL